MAVGRRTAAYGTGWTAGLPYPIRNVLRRRRGLIGMIAGVGIALGLGMAMLAINKAGIDLFSGDFRVSGANLYVITEGGTPIPILPGDTPGTIEDARHSLAQVRGLAGVRAAVGVMNWSLERERPGPKRPDAPKELVSTMGVDGDPSDIPGALVLKEGRWLRRTNEVMLGARLARERGFTLGDSIRLNGRDFQVVGIGRLRGFGFNADSVAYLDLRSLQQRSAVGDVVNTIAIWSSSPAATRTGLADLDSLSVYDPDELVHLAEQANQSGVVIRWILVVMILTIAALFVANMLSRSVAERRLEFATLRAIGVPRRTILASVAAEALVISASAFVVGLGISSVFGYLIDSTIAPAYGIESLYSTDLSLFGVVLALALGLGLLAGVFPARQAVRVEPVEVLREA
ncbi:MAG: ABC transporter permease [Chloroflexi bacterium]|nr:ABC transporter permease [Chloroflexota bacterium]